MQDLNTIQLAGRSPHFLSDLKMKLVDYFSKLGERKVELQEIRAMFYQAIRSEVKSDAAAERRWESTPEGLESMSIRQKMASIEHKIAAINSSLYVANKESKNQY